MQFLNLTLPSAVALVAFAYYLAFQLRFDSGVKGSYLLLLQRTWWWAMVISLVVFTLFRLYQRWWRYAGQRDYEAILRAVVVSTLALVGAVAVLHPVVRQVGDIPDKHRSVVAA